MRITSLIALAGLVSASVFTTAPTAETEVAADKPFTLKWQDDQTSPSADVFGPTTVDLYTGSHYQQTKLVTLGIVANPDKQRTLSVVIPSIVGPNGQFYFIRYTSMSAVDANNIPLTAFSAKFSMKGMKGEFDPAVSKMITATGSIADAPPTASIATVLASASPVTASFSVSANPSKTTANVTGNAFSAKESGTDNGVGKATGQGIALLVTVVAGLALF